MTLIDLQGKALYSGARKVISAHLGNNLFWEVEGALKPENFTDSSYAISVKDGVPVLYGSSLDFNAFSLNNGANTNTGGNAFSTGPNYLDLDNKMLILDISSKINKKVFYMEITVDKFDNNEKTDFHYLRTGLSNANRIADNDSYKKGSLLISTAFTSSNIDEPDTPLLTLAIKSDGVTTIAYINGVEVKRATSSAELANPVNSGGYLPYGNIANTASRRNYRIYDFKFGNICPTDEQIQQNYQNIQARLQTI